MSDYNFIRFFVILNENKKGYGMANAPSGYCKVESLNGNAVFTVGLRNLSYDKGPYRLYVILKSSDTPIFAGELTPAQDGTVYKSYQTSASNVFESGFEISALEAMHILSEDNESILGGYINRNITKQAQQYSDMKLKNIPSKADNSLFEAASTNTAEIVLPDSSLPEEIPSGTDSESAGSSPDDTMTDVSESAEKESADTSEESAASTAASSENSGTLSSYVQTLAKLYEGIMGASSSQSKKESDSQAESDKESSSCSYWDKVNSYYNNLFNNEESFIPFDFCKNNSKWILTSPYINCVQLIGLIYENGNVKYIVNGAPVYAGLFTMPCTAPSMIWLPAKNNCFGITGYWLTFIDAASGKAVEPNICIL